VRNFAALLIALFVALPPFTYSQSVISEGQLVLEARNLVEQAMLERQATELSEKQRLLSTPADLEVEDTFDDGTTVILRKIIPETASGKPVAPSLSPVRETQPTRTPSAFTGETIVNHRTVSLVVTVFDHTQSMIKWRFG